MPECAIIGVMLAALSHTASRILRPRASRLVRGLFLQLAVLAVFAAPGAVKAAQAVPGEIPVDVELVLAVDTSSSMQPFELALQRHGYSAAFRSPEVINAITEGIYGRVAVTYVEWGAANSRRVIVPWTLVASARDAYGVAGVLESKRIANLFQTSISGVIRFGARTLAANGFRSARRVIDISGDGPNNEGGSVTVARDMAIARQITINGLPLVLERGVLDRQGLPSLEEYYSDCVIGGPGAFILPVRSWKEFADAVRRKLMLELAGAEAPRLLYAAATSPAERNIAANSGRTDCSIGEKLRMGGG